MALLKKINNHAQTDKNSGFGTNANSYGGRFVNKNGTPNIEKRGMNFLRRISWYHTMIDMPTWKFLLILFTFYIAINFVFALLYYAIGINILTESHQRKAYLYSSDKLIFLVRKPSQQ